MMINISHYTHWVYMISGSPSAKTRFEARTFEGFPRNPKR